MECKKIIEWKGYRVVHLSNSAMVSVTTHSEALSFNDYRDLSQLVMAHTSKTLIINTVERDLDSKSLQVFKGLALELESLGGKVRVYDGSELAESQHFQNLSSLGENRAQVKGAA